MLTLEKHDELNREGAFSHRIASLIAFPWKLLVKSSLQVAIKAGNAEIHNIHGLKMTSGFGYFGML